jgi:antitoxin YefM
MPRAEDWAQFAPAPPVTYVKSYVTEALKMTSVTASEARKRLYSLLDELAESHDPVQIVGKRNSAVLVSADDWRAIQETLYLVAIPGMNESILKGMNTPAQKCGEKLDW